MALPENCPKDGGATDLPFHFSGRPSAALDHPQEPATLFCRCNQLRTYTRAMPAATPARCRGALWARRVSTVVVGTAIDASGQPQAFRWTRATRMQSVLTLLLAAKVVTMTGWQLRSANGVSADGTVIVGDGVDPLGLAQAWIARLPKEDNEDCEEDDDNQGDNDNQKDFGQ